MSWAEPIWGWALWLVLALALLAYRGQRSHVERLGTLFRGELLERVLPTSVRRRRAWSLGLTLTGLALLVLALAEPRYGKQLRQVEARGVDVVVAIDLSRSMDAEDIDPSRLERAHREVSDLLDILEGDRVGLVIFAGGAYPRMPLTRDLIAMEAVTRELHTRIFQAQGSALGQAIRTARNMFGGTDDGRGRAILVLSDGEVHDPADALLAAREAAQAGVTVYGMVIGDAPAPIPNGDGTFLLDPASGERVTTHPSDAILSDVARITGGAVVRSVPSDDDVTRLYRDEMRANLVATTTLQSQREQWNTLFPWPLGLGLFCLLAGAWLGDGRRVGVVLTLCLAVQTAHAGTRAEGDRAYRSGNYPEATRIFTELVVTSPDDPELLDRLAAAQYRQGAYEDATRALERRLILLDDITGKFNAANANYQAGHFDRAIELYEQILAVQPDHTPATTNRDLLRREMQLRRLEKEKRDAGKNVGGDEAGSPNEQSTPAAAPGEQDPGDQGEGQPSEHADPSSDNAEPGQPDASSQPSSNQPPSSDGTRPESSEPGGEATGDAPAGTTDAPPSADASSDETTASRIPRDQADRMLDSIEEGRPHIYLPGDQGEKPW